MASLRRANPSMAIIGSILVENTESLTSGLRWPSKASGGYLISTGKVRRRYRRQDVATPCEKLKSLTDAERFLEPGVTFAYLDRIACAASDLEANRQANDARDELFRRIGQVAPAAA